MTTRNAPVRGAVADRPMRDALIVELQEHGEGPDGAQLAKIRLVARRLVDKAVGGEATAIKEIFDRVDGRAPTYAEPPAPRAITYEERLDLFKRARAGQE